MLYLQTLRPVRSIPPKGQWWRSISIGMDIYMVWRFSDRGKGSLVCVHPPNRAETGTQLVLTAPSLFCYHSAHAKNSASRSRRISLPCPEPGGGEDAVVRKGRGFRGVSACHDRGTPAAGWHWSIVTCEYLGATGFASVLATTGERSGQGEPCSSSGVAQTTSELSGCRRQKFKKINPRSSFRALLSRPASTTLSRGPGVQYARETKPQQPSIKPPVNSSKRTGGRGKASLRACPGAGPIRKPEFPARTPRYYP